MYALTDESCSCYITVKSPRSFLRGLLCDRQQSILPGRFQPSTFDAWELNCCVRDGNRWGLPAIVTGSLNRLFVFPLRQACGSLSRHTPVCLRGARWPFLAASTKILVHASGPSRPSIPYRRNYSQNQLVFRSASKSSPRRISTGPLNTLLHLHSRPINLVFYKASY